MRNKISQTVEIVSGNAGDLRKSIVRHWIWTCGIHWLRESTRKEGRGWPLDRRGIVNRRKEKETTTYVE